MKGKNKYEGMSDETKRMLRGEPLIRRADCLCSEEQDQTTLERDRALLLAYVRRVEAMHDQYRERTRRTANMTVYPDMPTRDVIAVVVKERQSLIDAGLLEGADDGDH